MKPRYRIVTSIALLIVSIGWMAAQAQSPLNNVAEKKSEPASELDLIPRDAGMFVSIRVADLWQTDIAQPLRDLFAKERPEALAELEKQISLRPEQVERITILFPTVGPEMDAPLILITTIKPYNREKLLTALKAIEPRHRGFDGHDHPKLEFKKVGEPVPAVKDAIKIAPPPFDKKCGGVDEDEPKKGDKFQDRPVSLNAPFYVIEEMGEAALILIDDRTFAILPEAIHQPDTILSLLAQFMRRKDKGELTDSIAIATNHHITIGVNPGSLLKDIPDDLPVELLPLKSLLKTEAITITVDVGATSKFGVDIKLTDADAAKKAARALDAFRTIATEMMPGLRRQIAREPDSQVFLKMFDIYEKALNDATIEAKADRVAVRAEMKVDVALTLAITTATKRVREAAGRSQSMNNLKQIGLSFHNYESAYGHMPLPSDPQQPNKFPVSWRVLMLPYLEQDNLYRMYRFDEPWDSENNKKLIPLMPKTYEVAGHPTKEKGMTYFKVFNGREAMFATGQKRSIIATSDGTSNTIMVVEAADPVIWTQPLDIPYDAKQPLPKLGGHYPNIFMVVLGDGSVRTYRTDIKETTLRTWITANGGEIIPQD